MKYFYLCSWLTYQVKPYPHMSQFLLHYFFTPPSFFGLSHELLSPRLNLVLSEAMSKTQSPCLESSGQHLFIRAHAGCRANIRGYLDTIPMNRVKAYCLNYKTIIQVSHLFGIARRETILNHVKGFFTGLS